MTSSSSSNNETTPSLSSVSCNDEDESKPLSKYVIKHEDESKPLWKYVTKHQRLSEQGGNISWQCNFCHAMKRSSYTRVRAHLLKIRSQGVRVCPKVTPKDIVDMKKLEDEVNVLVERKASKNASLPTLTTYFGGTSRSPLTLVEPKKRKGCTSVLERSSDEASHDQLHAHIARMFYSSGLPFHFAKNLHFIRAFTYAANNLLPGYVPPGYNLLRTSLLQKEKENVERILQPIKNAWSENGVSIVSHGWSEQRPSINFMATTEGRPIFLKAVDLLGETKDKYFIANLMKDVINEVGHQNVVQVITDNTPICEGAGQIIEAQFPMISWSPCIVHSLNLALRNICNAKDIENDQLLYKECSWVSDVVDDVMVVRNFIMNHSMRLTMFEEFVSLKLLSVAETRFASAIIMLKRFKLIKGGLQGMVTSDKWTCYREIDGKKARHVKDLVLNDIWWDKIDYILSFTSPICDMIRACDSDLPCLHLVYDMWKTMTEKVKMKIYGHEGKHQDEFSSFYNVVHKILVDRWNKNNTSLYCLAHSLNPRYYCEEWLQEDNSRLPPHTDLEVARGRMKCLKKYFSTAEERARVTIEFANFCLKSKDFSDLDSMHDRNHMDPKSWWVIHGIHAPILQSLALKLLVQPSSSSCCERNWSTYSFVNSIRHNKTTPQRAKDLVFVHSNLRLLSRKTPCYLKGESKLWDIGGDSFGSFEDVGVLEVANLSLDEPDLEAMVFTDVSVADIGDKDEVVMEN